MRTQEEIIAQAKKLQDTDIFGFEINELLARLSVENFKQFAKPDADLSDWNQLACDEATIKAEMENYMSFAWEKALGHRGLSASRSISHMRAWLWLLGDDSLVAFADAGINYPNYGAPILATICAKYHFVIPSTAAATNMAAGKPCYDGCSEGCGT